MVTRSIFLILLTLGFLPGALFADESAFIEESDFSFLPFYLSPDESRADGEQGFGAQVNYGRHFRPNWRWEIQAFGDVIETGNSAVTDFYQVGTSADLVYLFTKSEGFRPFALGGLGLVYDDVVPDSDDSINLYANVGLGLFSPEVTESGIRFRGEFRYIYDSLNSGMSDWRLGIGITIPIGRKIEVVRIKETVVIEYVTVVDVDTDSDGVVDQRDQCPGTISGAAVNVSGCVVEMQTFVLEGVNFEFGSAKLTTEAVVALDAIARSLKNESALNIEIAGHTDDRGSDEYNLNLSRTRAEAVKDNLVASGINAERFLAVGYGENDPIAANNTELGRALNRRVEFRILGDQPADSENSL